MSELDPVVEIEAGLDQAFVTLKIEIVEEKVSGGLGPLNLLMVFGMAVFMFLGIAFDMVFVAIPAAVLLFVGWLSLGPSLERERQAHVRNLHFRVTSRGVERGGKVVKLKLRGRRFELDGIEYRFARRPNKAELDRLRELIEPRDLGREGEVPLALRRARSEHRE